ncbi:MAG: deoxyribodipyrimidine photolyase [Gemmatimonadota bacterium]
MNRRPVRLDARYVLYWMVAHRRLSWNFALDRAIELARTLQRPLLVFEPLRCGYRWAAERHHRFVIDGMVEHRAALSRAPVFYLPYLEPHRGAGSGLLEHLARDAAVVVSDDFPAFFLPRMHAAAAGRVDTRLEIVDSNGLLPMRSTDQVFSTAFAFRRYLQRQLPEHLLSRPAARPDWSGLPVLDDLRLPDAWRAADPILDEPEAWDGLPVDRSVRPVPFNGGSGPARARLHAFLDHELGAYPEDRRHPDRGGTSGLSPWLHWGHLSAHEVVDATLSREGWTPLRLSDRVDGRREGWWGLGAAAEGFLDELVTWREIGFNMCALRSDYDSYESLPDWARETLEAHEVDERPYLYDLAAFEGAETHDPLWNAAQRQLVAEGRIHNYLRMLWGKKILEWTPSARDALEIMIELNNKYGIDGRDPNSYSGIFWTLGRYDRGWPEREVFGKVRSMTSESTRRKVEVDCYLERWGPGGSR